MSTCSGETGPHQTPLTLYKRYFNLDLSPPVHIYLSFYLSVFISTCRFISSIYLSIYLSILFISIYPSVFISIYLSVWFALVLFYAISTLAGCLMPNPVYTYILNTYMISKHILSRTFEPELFLHTVK